MLITQSPLKDSEGRFHGLVQALTDITEQKTLLRTLERRVHQLSIVKEIGEALHRTMDLDEVLHLILVGATAGPGLRFNRAFLLFADEDGTRLSGRLALCPSNSQDAGRIWGALSQRPVTLRQMLSQYETSLAETDQDINRLVQGLVVPLEEREDSVVARSLRTGVAFAAPGELAGPDRELADRLGAGTFAVAPLQTRGRVIGALIADNAITGRQIQADDVEMLQLLATTASIAIDNSRLYAELATRLAMLESARAETRRQQEELLRTERLTAIGEMAATVAHEVRNPLVAIGGFARAILRRTQPSDSRYEHLIMIEEVARLEGIVTKVLDYARPVSPNVRSAQINRVLEGAAVLLDEELAANSVKVSLELDPGLPLVPADTDRIFELAINLLRNAMQAMPGGGTATIGSRRAGTAVEMRFADTGGGIPAEIRDRIFPSSRPRRQDRASA